MFAAPAFVATTLGPGQRPFVSWWFIFGALAFVGVLLCLIARNSSTRGRGACARPRSSAAFMRRAGIQRSSRYSADESGYHALG